MNAMKNKVQLIGNVGNEPEVKTFREGKKVANITIATNDYYTNDKGEKVVAATAFGIIKQSDNQTGNQQVYNKPDKQQGKIIGVESRVVVF